MPPACLNAIAGLSSDMAGGAASRTLYAELVKYGRTITIKRFLQNGTVAASIDVKAMVRPRPAPSDTTAHQGRFLVILTDEEMVAGGWSDRVRRGDRITFDGRDRTVANIDELFEGETVCRIELDVGG